MTGGARLSVGEALLIMLFSATGLLLFGGLLAGEGPLGLATAEVLFIGAPAALGVRHRGRAAGLALARPSARALVGAALVGASGWAFLGTLVLPLQERLLPTPPALEEALRQAAAPELAALVAVALVPAICEELLVRGALAFALARRYGRPAGVVGSALVFALLHGSPYRFVPTFLLGCSFAAIALEAGSIVPTMLAHLLNNGLVWTVGALPALERGLDSWRLPVAATSVVLLTVGHAVVFSRFPERR